jgi:hypothetical protein
MSRTPFKNPKYLPATDREGTCTTCGQPVPIGSKAWYHNGKLYCIEHKPVGGEGDIGGGGSSSSSNSSSSPQRVVCPSCRELVDDVSGAWTTIMYPDGIEARVCTAFCKRLMTAQYNLKMSGLWRVPRRASKAKDEHTDAEQSVQEQGKGSS